MIYKIACGVLLLGVIFLGTRLKVAEDRTQTLIEDLTIERADCLQIQENLKSLNAQVDTLLIENGELIIANNQLKSQTPETIIKYVKKKPTVNGSASEQYIDALSKRYEFQ